jgi:hypothetical protein
MVISTTNPPFAHYNAQMKNASIAFPLDLFTQAHMFLGRKNPTFPLT